MIEAKSEGKKDEPGGLHELDLPGTVSRQTIEDILLSRRMMSGHTACDSSADSDWSAGKGSVKEPKPNHFYKFQYLPKKFFKIRFDRLALLALLDRSVGLFILFFIILFSLINFFHFLTNQVYQFKIIDNCFYYLLSVSPCNNQTVGETWYEQTHHFDNVI